MILTQMASDLILAQVQQRNITADSLTDWLRTTHDTLLDLWVTEQGPRAEAMVHPIDWCQSIGRDNITCLVCGGEFRQLSPVPLRVHGISAREYRERFRMPRDQLLSSRRVTRRRSEAVHRTKPWVKAMAARWAKGAK